MICQKLDMSAVQIKFSPKVQNQCAIGAAQHFGLAGNSNEFDLQKNSVALRNILTIENAITELTYSESQPNIICTGNAIGKFKMFDTTKQNSLPLIDIPVHSKSINSISCNKFLPFLYLTTSDDGKINLIDTKAQKVDMVHQYQQNKANKIIWHPQNKNLFVTAELQGSISLFDLRTKNKQQVLIKTTDQILSMDFNLFEDSIACGSANTMISLYDLKNCSLPQLVLTGHRYSVNQVKYSPHDKNNLISCSYDMSVKVWNTINVSKPLVKSHDKHREFVYDIDYSRFVKGLIGSASLDKRFCIFNQLGEQPFML